MRTYDGGNVKIEAIKCKACGRIGLSVDDIRITPHKCSGQWLTVAEAEYEPPRDEQPPLNPVALDGRHLNDGRRAR